MSNLKGGRELGLVLLRETFKSLDVCGTGEVFLEVGKDFGRDAAKVSPGQGVVFGYVDDRSKAERALFNLGALAGQSSLASSTIGLCVLKLCS